MANGSSFDAEPFIESGRILYAKLFATLFGAIWLVMVGGWIIVTEAIVEVHVRLLEVAQSQLVRTYATIFGGGADIITYSWASAYRAAVETEPILAPLTLVVEIIATVAMVTYLRERVI